MTRAPMNDGNEETYSGLSGEGYRWVVNCNVAAMRASASFLNEYVDNIGRNFNIFRVYEQRVEQLVALEAVLAARL